MEENSKSKQPSSSSLTNFWNRYKQIILIVVIAGILILLLIFGNDFFRSSKIFTQYDQIKLDSVERQTDTITSTKAKEIPPEPPETKAEELIPVEPSDTSSPGLFSVNTHYDKIVEPGISDRETMALQEGLFEELLLPAEEDRDFEQFYSDYRSRHILSAQSILKVLAITGRSILLEHSDADDQMILQVLTESEKVNGIFIIDSKGKIIYATNRKYLNTYLAAIMPEIDLTKIKIARYQYEEEDIVSIPIFHTYGKIGTAVLITAKGE